MLIKVELINKEVYNYILPNESSYSDFLRDIKGISERHTLFLTLSKQFLYIKDKKDKYILANKEVLVNINHIISIEVDREIENKAEVEVKEDDSNLLAAKQIVRLEGEALAKAQEEKQPLIGTMKSAQEREIKLRKEQKLA